MEQLVNFNNKKDLRPIAKALGIKNYAYMKKVDIINSILEIEVEDYRIEEGPKIYDMRIEQLQKLKIKDLRPIVKSLGIKNYAYMKKDLLIDEIIDFETDDTLIIIEKYYKDKNNDQIKDYRIGDWREQIRRLKMEDLRPMAKSFGLRNFSYMKKAEIIDSILDFETDHALFIIEKYYKDKNNDEIEHQKIIQIFLEIELDACVMYKKRIMSLDICLDCGGTDYVEDDTNIICLSCWFHYNKDKLYKLQMIGNYRIKPLEIIPKDPWEAKKKESNG